MSALELVLLICATASVRLAILKPAEPPVASGAAIMAVGIFALGAMQQMPAGFASLTQPLAIELAIVWAYVAAGIARVWLSGRISTYTIDAIGRFAIGTWVAGTAVVARLLYISVPEWRILAYGLGIITLLIWLWYMRLIIPRFAAIAADPVGLRVTGRILLATVSTQSIVVLADILFPGSLPPWLALGLIGLGCLFYIAGLVLILRRYIRDKGWNLPADWDNTNCILHGAISITGLASVLSRAVPDAVIMAIWVFATMTLFAVEGVELVRLLACITMFGWRQGVLKYNVSQWARNFTFGMFYIFTLRLRTVLPQETEASWPVLATLQDLVVSWGQYIVFGFLLVEVGLFFAENIGHRRQALSVQHIEAG